MHLNELTKVASRILQLLALFFGSSNCWRSFSDPSNVGALLDGVPIETQEGFHCWRFSTAVPFILVCFDTGTWLDQLSDKNCSRETVVNVKTVTQTVYSQRPFLSGKVWQWPFIPGKDWKWPFLSGKDCLYLSLRFMTSWLPCTGDHTLERTSSVGLIYHRHLLEAQSLCKKCLQMTTPTADLSLIL